MWIQLLILGMVIGFNNFATALALGALGQEKRLWRILTVFAAFEFGVPLIGLWLGQNASEYLSGKGAWLGPLLLAALGVMTLFQSTRDTRSQKALARKMTTWRGLILLSAGLSLDNLVIGFSLGLGGIPPLAMAATIMVLSVIFAWIGLQIGGRSRRNFESLTEVISGLLLIALALMKWSGLL